MTKSLKSSELSTEMQAQLEQLKDITLPDPISWWPLAVGWWILIALFIISAIGGYWLIKKRQEFKNNVLAELHNIPINDDVKFVSELSALLRRVAIHYENNYRVQFVQNLSGKAWAEFLSHGADGDKDYMPKELAIQIANIPYADKWSAKVDTEQLRQTSEAWILQMMKEGR